jgi:hypothetical protein
MNAAQFNGIYESAVVAPLTARGFVRRRRSLFYSANNAVLALLRFETKAGGLLQATNFIVCIRHTFLRELSSETVPEPLVEGIDNFPVKERPSTLSPALVQSWRYRPINLGVRSDDYDTLEYGRTNDLEETHGRLTGLSRNVLAGGMALLERLSADELVRQLKEHGENAWCERLWIEDYERFLSMRTPADT